MTREDASIIIAWYSDICATSSDLTVALDAYGDELKGFVGELDGRVVASVVRTPTAEGISYESLLYVEAQFRMFGYGKRMKEAAEKSMVGGILCIDAHEELLRMNQARGFTRGFDLTHFTGPVTSPSVDTRVKRPSSAKIEMVGCLISLCSFKEYFVKFKLIERYFFGSSSNFIELFCC